MPSRLAISVAPIPSAASAFTSSAFARAVGFLPEYLPTRAARSTQPFSLAAFRTAKRFEYLPRALAGSPELVSKIARDSDAYVEVRSDSEEARADFNPLSVLAGHARKVLQDKTAGQNLANSTLSGKLRPT